MIFNSFFAVFIRVRIFTINNVILLIFMFQFNGIVRRSFHVNGQVAED
jgi:hypothetical protein